MEQDLPQPTYELKTPAAGWWKAPAAIGSDPIFLRVPDELRMSAVALHVSALGWALNHAATLGWIPGPAVLGGQVIAAPRDQLEGASAALIGAGLWVSVEMDGLAGYVVAGAAKAVQERFARQNSASNAGRTSQSNQARAAASRYPTKPRTPDPNKYVDWSKETGEL